jgi:hypothetical protein
VLETFHDVGYVKNLSFRPPIGMLFEKESYNNMLTFQVVMLITKKFGTLFYPAVGDFEGFTCCRSTNGMATPSTN